jgi:hypothetical protein
MNWIVVATFSAWAPAVLDGAPVAVAFWLVVADWLAVCVWLVA